MVCFYGFHVGRYIPYMDPMGNRVLFLLQCLDVPLLEALVKGDGINGLKPLKPQGNTTIYHK